MKVALELQPCCWTRSGIGTYTYELAKRLKSGNGIEFCGNIFNFLGRHDNATLLSEISMPIWTNKMMPYGVYRRIWNCVPIWYSQLFPNDADISLFFNFIVPPRINGKVVTVIHDLTYLRYPETVKKSNYEHLKKGIKYSIQRSSKVLTTSQFTKCELEELLNVPREKISVVYSAPSISLGTIEPTTIYKKFGITGDYILFVSTIEPRKNVVRLLHAFDHLKRIYKIPHQLVFAGGKGWQDQEIIQVVRSISCKKDLIFAGFVTNEERNTLYQNASLFVYPSIYEGFGMPPLEAMYWGCPVVCSNAASMPEIVGDAAQLVDPFEELSIAEGIMRVLSDGTYADYLRAKGRKRARQFSWEASTEQMFQVLKEVGDM